MRLFCMNVLLLSMLECEIVLLTIKTGANTKLFSTLTVILPKLVAAPADPFTIANSSLLSSCNIDFLLIPSLFLWMYLDFVHVFPDCYPLQESVFGWERS